MFERLGKLGSRKLVRGLAIALALIGLLVVTSATTGKLPYGIILDSDDSPVAGTSKDASDGSNVPAGDGHPDGSSRGLFWWLGGSINGGRTDKKNGSDDKQESDGSQDGSSDDKPAVDSTSKDKGGKDGDGATAEDKAEKSDEKSDEKSEKSDEKSDEKSEKSDEKSAKSDEKSDEKSKEPDDNDPNLAKSSKQSFNPDHILTYPTINLDDDIDVNLEKLGIRKMSDHSQSSAPFHKEAGEHKVAVSSYVGSRIADEVILDSPDDLVCPDIKYTPDAAADDDDGIIAADAIELDDPRIGVEMGPYLKKTGYRLFMVHDDTMNNWFKFSGSATWLPAEKCYMVVSRYTYGKARNDPKFSISRLQLFDSDWKELFDRRIRRTDVTEDDVRHAFAQYDVAQNDKEKEEVLDKISLRFPTFMTVDVLTNEMFKVMGPEDPKIALRPNDNGGEPVILFSMKLDRVIRRMYVGLPLRKVDEDGNTPSFKLEFADDTPTHTIEKNWSLYFKDDDASTGKFGSAHIVYNWDPLVIARCDLDKKTCITTQDSNKLAIEEGGSLPKAWDAAHVYIRGGCNLVPFPPELMNKLNPSDDSDLKLWLSFPKTHVGDCCGSAFYRPFMAVMARQNDKYTVSMLSDPTDFGVHVLNWEMKLDSCDSRANVLNVNSVTQWTYEQDDTALVDQLDVTFSMADARDYHLSLRGVGAYLLKVFESGKFHDSLTYAGQRGRMLSNCFQDAAGKACHDYEDFTKDLEKQKKQEEEKKKKEEAQKKKEEAQKKKEEASKKKEEASKKKEEGEKAKEKAEKKEGRAEQ